ncbi:ATP-binding protein [uncultured Prevotella sp.]|uniref:AAA family ATPase n=1 Tax=uncultured Prevotella sp. TaxID=159272 RepID=UPI0025850842|nr:ATP-binding protein [uncultured Prevotella sp.]
MILNLEFKNYRSFKGSCSFTTEPTSSKAKANNLCEVETKAEGSKKALKISLIFGANASGKTNLIKFLYGFRRWVLNMDNRVGEDIVLYQPFRFDSETTNVPIEFSLEFIAQKIRYKYEVSFTKTQIESESLISYPNGKQTQLYERTLLPDDKESDTIKLGASLAAYKPFNVFKNQLLLSKFLKDTPCEPITNAAKYLADMVISNGFHEDTILGEDKEMLRWLYSHPDNKKMLVEFLAFADTGVADFQLEKRSGNVEVTSLHGLYKDGEGIGKTDLPFREESFGTRALFIIGCHILQALQSGSPFFIDEMDSGLHSYVTQLIVDIFRNERINKKNAQLIFTTHDVNLLDQNTIRKDQVWFTEKDEYGISEIFTLSDFDDVREDTLFAKWYLNNKFGGVPSLQSLEKLFVENGKK